MLQRSPFAYACVWNQICIVSTLIGGHGTPLQGVRVTAWRRSLGILWRLPPPQSYPPGGVYCSMVFDLFLRGGSMVFIWFLTCFWCGFGGG